jgi:acyl dehydratase
MALVARQLYFEAVKVGDELPPIVKPPVDRIQIARYAGAAEEYGPLHVDEAFARNAGFPSVLAPGMIAMGFLGELVVDWLRGARLRRFSARFVKIVWPGDVLSARARVTERRFEEGGRYLVDIETWAENQRGELVVRGTVTAQLYYSAEDEARQRAGQPPLVVTPREEEERLARLSRSGAAPRPAPPSRPGAPPPRSSPAGPQRPPVPGPARPGSAAVPVRPAAAVPAGPGRPALAPPPRPSAPTRPAPRATARPAAKRKAKAGARSAARPATRKGAPQRRAPRPGARPARKPAKRARPPRKGAGRR